MSRILVDQVRSNSASSDALTLDGSGNVTVPGNITLSGTATGFPKGKAQNLIINGAMQVAQRGTSSTTNGYGSVDRFPIYNQSTDEAPTHAQVDVASGTTPYTLGFRKALKITNGNQTSGAGGNDLVAISYGIEAQDLATSGWNYLSSSSNITLSFWVKSSVAQNFYVMIRSEDGTQYNYVVETGSLSADTWTKVTKTIPGNSNLTINNDNGRGMLMEFVLFRGTNGTGSLTLNQWAAYDTAARVPDMTSTWYTTNDATFEITGVQLEVGDSASDFTHESYAETLRKCQRYCVRYNQTDTGELINICGAARSAHAKWFVMHLSTPMRSDPTVTRVGQTRLGMSDFTYENGSDTLTVGGVTPTAKLGEPACDKLIFYYNGTISGMTNQANAMYFLMWNTYSSGVYTLTFDAEL